MVSRDCDYLTTLILCLVLGVFGAHRFYTRKFGTAICLIIVSIITCGLGGVIWCLIDLVSICQGKFTTAECYHLVNDPRA